jgi:hypothetical protein
VPNDGVRKVGYTGIAESEMCGEQGGYSSEPQGTRVGLYRSMVNSSSDETSVGMYNLGIGSWSDHIGGLCATTSLVWVHLGLVSVRDQFEHDKWWCEEGWIY